MGTNTMQQGGLDYENIVNLFANVEKSNIDHIRTNPQEGFFSFDVVCNAYEKGRKDGKKQLMEQLTSSIKDQYKKTLDQLMLIINNFEKKGFSCTKFFANVQEMSIMLAFEEKVYKSDEFINFAYNYYTEEVQLGYLPDNKYLNITLIKANGFSVAYDAKNKQELYKADLAHE